MEICSNLHLDGHTPSIDLVSKILKQVSIPVKVMIRTNSIGFRVNKKEINTLINSIKSFKNLGINEIVFGFLNNKNELDYNSIHLLAEISRPMNITFHKAIDKTENIIKSIDALTNIDNIKSILTSGSMDTALEGVKMIKEIYKIYGQRFNVIAAGSITKYNLMLIHSQLNLKYYHGRLIV